MILRKNELLKKNFYIFNYNQNESICKLLRYSKSLYEFI